jgi:signal transduction histidine kinase
VGALALLLGVSYYLAARLGLGFRFADSQLGIVWPGNAVLVTALLLVPRARWWWVFAIIVPVHVAMTVLPTWRWSWQLAVNVAFVLTTVETLRRVAGLPLAFGNRRQVFVFMAVAITVSLLYALITPSFVRALSGVEPGLSPHVAFLRSAFTNASSLLIVTPVALLWSQHGVRRLGLASPREVLEATAVAASMFAAGLVAFGTGAESARFPSLLLLLFLPLLWSAVRLGPLGASTSLLFAAAFSVWGTARSLGPFVQLSDADKVLSLHLFWLMLWAPIMLLAAVIRERDDAEAALHAQRTQLAHVTRAATVGELSGALAHELRQPLMSILANARAGVRMLAHERVDLQEVRTILEDIAQDDKHAATVIGRMRTFLKDGQSAFQPLSIGAVIRDTLALSRSTVELARVRVETGIPIGIPRVRGDPVQLLQVLLNLVVNGCEAMSRTPIAERRLVMRVQEGKGGFVEIQVSDAGAGLPGGAEHRVFEPFFTSKLNGLGLGLSICRSIVNAHGGRLWAENNAGRGATFHLTLHAERNHAGHTLVDRGS